MRALTLHQPWAWAIAHADKRIENRGPRPMRGIVGQQLAIHAGKAFDDEAAVAMWEGRYGDAARLCPVQSEVTTSCIVAVVRVFGVAMVPREVREKGFAVHPWWAGPFGLLLTDVVTLGQPVWCRGMQGYWNVPPLALHQVEGQLAALKAAAELGGEISGG